MYPRLKTVTRSWTATLNGSASIIHCSYHFWADTLDKVQHDMYCLILSGLARNWMCGAHATSTHQQHTDWQRFPPSLWCMGDNHYDTFLQAKHRHRANCKGMLHKLHCPYVKLLCLDKLETISICLGVTKSFLPLFSALCFCFLVPLILLTP